MYYSELIAFAICTVNTVLLQERKTTSFTVCQERLMCGFVKTRLNHFGINSHSNLSVYEVSLPRDDRPNGTLIIHVCKTTIHFKYVSRMYIQISGISIERIFNVIDILVVSEFHSRTKSIINSYTLEYSTLLVFRFSSGSGKFRFCHYFPIFYDIQKRCTQFGDW